MAYDASRDYSYDTEACGRAYPDEWWSETVVEDFVRLCAVLGVETDEKRVYWTGFWSQGDGACFVGTYRYAKGALKEMRAYAPEDEKLHAIAQALQDVQRRNFYSLSATTTHRDRYCHEHSVRVDVASALDDGYRGVSTDDEEAVADALRDLMRWLYRALETEYRYASARESGRAFRLLAQEVFADGRKLLAERRVAGVETDEWRMEWEDWREARRGFLRAFRGAAPGRYDEAARDGFFDAYREGAE